MLGLWSAGPGSLASRELKGLPVAMEPNPELWIRNNYGTRSTTAPLLPNTHILRIEDGILVEHWDVIQDEADRLSLNSILKT